MSKVILQNMTSLPVIADLSKKEQAFLCSYLTSAHYEAGEVILMQGNVGSALFLLVSGVVSVQVTMPGNVQKVVSELQRGQIFGEVAFIANAFITATFIAQEPCECVILSGNIFSMLRVGFPEIAYKIERAVIHEMQDSILDNLARIHVLVASLPKQYLSLHNQGKRIINAKATRQILETPSMDWDFVCKMSFFKSFDTPQITALHRLITIAHYEKGYIFPTDAKSCHRLAMIYSGAVMSFIKHNDVLQKSIAVLGIGELFLPGGFSLEFREINQYVTCEKTVLLEMDFEDYIGLHTKAPAIFYELSHALYKMMASAVYHGNRQFVRLHSEYTGLFK